MNILTRNNRNRIVELAPGLKNYRVRLKLTSDSTIQTKEGKDVSIIYVSEGEEIPEDTPTTTKQTKQHFGGKATLNSDGSQVVTFTSLGFPSTIQLASIPRIIPWSDRLFILEDYDNSSLTVRPSAVGVANTPFTIGVEVIGYSDAIPNYVYDPFVIGRILREDKSFYPFYWDEELIMIKGIPGGIANYPVTCGLFISGKVNESDTEYSTWYVEMELDSDLETFEYKDMNVGNADSEVHRVTVELDSESETKYFGSLGLPPNIENARVSAFAPLMPHEGFVTACTDTYVTINASAVGVANFPLRYALEIRGG